MAEPLIQGPELFAVRQADRRPLVDFLVDGLRAADCRVMYSSRADRAPFVIVFETAQGERHGVIAYAFLATRTPTRNRPADERSFQIKYGSKDGRLHTLWQDPLGLFTTLLVGIDPQDGFFVAADPELHNPTRFFIRLEFKDRDAEALKDCGWHAWERQHRGPVHVQREERLYAFETLLGGTQDRVLELIRFERAAQGLPPGDRQLLAERWLNASVVESGEAVGLENHPLLAEFDLKAAQVLQLISGARRLKMAVRGWVAEEKLRGTLARYPGVTECERLDVEGGPDLRLRWRNGPPLQIECKNVLRKTTALGLPRIDFQRTRASKADPCSRYYMPEDFDIVAGCLHAVTERWEFRYIQPELLTPHKSCRGRLASNVTVDGAWSDEPSTVFERAYARL